MAVVDLFSGFNELMDDEPGCRAHPVALWRREESQVPIHFEDREVASEAAGLRSALIVPCYLCPAVTVATRENRPFLRLFRNPMKSAPFDEYLEALRSRLGERGVGTKVFRSRLYHHWFMCMWTARRRKKLAEQAQDHDAVIVLGCDSATQTVRDAVPAGVKVVEGMKTAGITNARLRFRLPDHLFFDGCKVVPFSQRKAV